MIIEKQRRPSDTSLFAILDQPRLTPAENPIDFANTAMPEPDDWRERVDDLLGLYNVEDDWDGGGSPAPERSVLSGAMKIALKLQKLKWRAAGRVTASVNGTICFEWHTADGYLEIEVMSPLYAEQYWIPKGANEAEITPIPIT